MFENSTLEHLMDVLAQWYDIKKVNYTDDKLRKIHFTGNLKRYGSAERIMKAIMDGAGPKAGAIVFSLPVTDTAGLRLLEDEEPVQETSAQ